MASSTVTETVAPTPHPFESAKILETAAALLWRSKAISFGLILCIFIAFTAFFFSLSPLLQFLFDTVDYQMDQTVPFGLAWFATAICVPVFLQPPAVDLYLLALKGERATFLSSLRTTAFQAVPALAIAIIIFLGCLVAAFPFAIFATALHTVLRAADPAFVNLIIILVACLIAASLLIIPGIALYTALFVAIPVRRLERGTIVSSFTRSYRLTKGHRFEVFGLLVGLVLGTFFAGAPLLLSVAAVIKLLSLIPLPFVVGSIAAFLLLFAFSAIFIIWSFAHAIAYIDLRRLTEDGLPEFSPPPARPANPSLPATARPQPENLQQP